MRRRTWVALIGLVFSACDSSVSEPSGGGGATSDDVENISSGGATAEAGGRSSGAGAPPKSGGSGGSVTGGAPSFSGGQSGGGGKHAEGTTSLGGDSSGTGGMELGGEGTGGSASGGAPASGGGQGTGHGDVVAQGVRWVGRVGLGESTRFAWSGTGFVARFSGAGLTATLTNAEGYLFQVVLDGIRQDAFLAKRGESAYALVSGLPPGEHIVELYRQTEGRYGESQLKSIEVEGGELLAPPPGPDAVIEVIGDSISCGYGNLGADASCSFSIDTESHWDSYGAIAGRALGVDVHTIAFSGHGLMRNNDGTTTDLLPDLYGRTLTKDPALLWVHTVEPQVIVVNLGTNDFAQGNPGTTFEEQYSSFLSRLREIHPNAFLLLTLGPMMKGANLNAARAYVQNAILAFEADGNEGQAGFLEYSGQNADELGCNSHPNVAKHESMAGALASRIDELGLSKSRGYGFTWR